MTTIPLRANSRTMETKADAAASRQARESPAKIEEAARQFESLLLAQLLKTARGSSEGWLGAGEDHSAASAMEMAEEQFAAALSAQGGLGLARLVASGLKAG